MKRRILIDKSELKEALKIIRGCIATHNWVDTHISGVQYYNCGWAKAPNCYGIQFNARSKIWFEILQKFAKHGIHLLPETIGY